MFDTCLCNIGSPLYACFIVVVYCCKIVSLLHYQIVGTIFQGMEFCCAFICCHDIVFARYQGGLILADRLPSNEDSRAENEKTIMITKLEKFQRRAIIECNTKLITPGSTTEIS